MSKKTVPENIPEELRTLFASMHNENVALREENNSLRRKLYGSKAETHIKEEMILPKDLLFNEPELLVQEEELEKQKKKIKVESHEREQGKRKPLPSDLPREQKVHDLPDEDKFCKADGTPLEKIGEDVIEKLDIEPARLKVVQHIYPKYACPCCRTGVDQEKAEASVLPKAQFEPGLLAYIIGQKYLMGMPLYRLEKDLEQKGVDLPRTTMARWVVAAAEFLKPLFNEMKKFTLLQGIVHCDETPLQVLKGTGKAATSKSYMWVLATPEDAPTVACLTYDPRRAGSVADRLLADFKGYLQVDGYAAYNSIAAKPDVTRVGCWAHVRRKFDDAKIAGAQSGSSLSSLFLNDIQDLFMLERRWKDIHPDERLEQRKIYSVPIVERIKSNLDIHAGTVPEKSKIGRALTYLANEWPYLVRFLENGRLSLSNNRCENLIRPFAIGRKAWLFSDSVEGAEASACLYSIVITAKENKVYVWKYLQALFSELPEKFASVSRLIWTPTCVGHGNQNPENVFSQRSRRV